MEISRLSTSFRANNIFSDPSYFHKEHSKMKKRIFCQIPLRPIQLNNMLKNHSFSIKDMLNRQTSTRRWILIPKFSSNSHYSRSYVTKNITKNPMYFSFFPLRGVRTSRIDTKSTDTHFLSNSKQSRSQTSTKFGIDFPRLAPPRE